MAETSPDGRRHVAVFPFPFGGHASPLLNLVIKLARAVPLVTFSFLTTQQNHKSLVSFIPDDIPDNIKFYTISDGNPDGRELSRRHQSMEIERFDLFLEAGPENLRKGLSLVVSETNVRVTCIISDAFVTSALAVAQELGVPWVAFWVTYTFALSAILHRDLIRQKYYGAGGDDDDGKRLGLIRGLYNTQVRDLARMMKLREKEVEESTFYKMVRSIGTVLPRAKAVMVNFYQELDPPELFEDLRSKMANVIYTGILTLSRPHPRSSSSNIIDESGSLQWLDKQNPKSVAYISLGTTVTPSAEEILAIAEALEESGVPFLWSIKEEFKASLPDEFLKRSSMKGKVVPWAPQTLVLGHDSVGVYVTHGGCNSVGESISSGVPMICRPYLGDQVMVASVIEHVWGIGVKLETGFNKNELIKCLDLVLMQQEGKVMRQRTQALKKVLLQAAGPGGKTVQELTTLIHIVSS